MREDKIIASYLDDEWRTPSAVHRLMKECSGDHAANQIGYALERLARAGKIEHKREYTIPFDLLASTTLALFYGKLQPICVNYYRKLQSH